jgi:hypothetical protein
MRSIDLPIALATISFLSLARSYAQLMYRPPARLFVVNFISRCNVDPNKLQEKDNAVHRKLYLRANQGPPDSNEPIEVNCVCDNKSLNAAELMALCASCIKQQSDKTDGLSRTTPSECPNCNLLMLEENQTLTH